MKTAQANELYMTERGAAAQEWYYVPEGKPRPVRCDWFCVGRFRDEQEVNAFIDFTEHGAGFGRRVRRSYVISSYANWRKYHRAEYYRRNPTLSTG